MNGKLTRGMCSAFFLSNGKMSRDSHFQTQILATSASGTDYNKSRLLISADQIDLQLSGCMAVLHPKLWMTAPNIAGAPLVQSKMCGEGTLQHAPGKD
jgi:hypothetical protein